ncbi:Pyrroline-5-carboxylate reductase [Aquisphaera giovannonii]|uniref:Pyrroline-5-carboxylate reductase n=1 Tax=Aquisphaera giovannonii TaxID=406548 RepID=A0A5B9WE63_9BACT|nr:pyrroline-5-carboxylate reductase [Aquisphaera giovannonii]QEH38519.1 Pyrroline-5-carboxylate reductase [Aquisphaera giovannonii]
MTRSSEDTRPASVGRRWGFIGAGKMATALVQGMLRSGAAERPEIAASDPLEAARTSLGVETGVAVFPENPPVVEVSDILVLAVKPQSMRKVLAELRPLVGPEHLVISIAAGVPISTLVAGLGPDRRVVRVMPNTPALLGEGASAYALGPGVAAADQDLVERFLTSVGRVVRVPEALLDAVTGLSGSGPAFVYLMIEALSDGGVRVGLPRDIATTLAAQTVLGAARMVLETGLHPGVLKDQVTSPGGTTIAGVHALEARGVRGALIDAVEAATARSAELSAAATPAEPPAARPRP